ncbi:DUF5085 family protein [Rummeliibacillus sp. POC4]|jgi:hypothetical protein|uniref:DUF5085 family protein n=1 Tax=Rummeliibacillus sp. POC4 TaxID=2305899 RepID=UPI000E670A48|nr:DUF5085 family protein [Rummeliibacillus sp. POC4]RIJ63198.1 DUF5085 family protein [Rummeliibacillus sp. POC4]
MVVDFETMMYKNVVWHTYEIHFSQFELVMEDFNEKLVKANLTIAGPLFYALHNIPFDEKMLIDIYIPVEQTHIPKDSDLFFQSYFYIDEMLMTRVRDNFEVKTEKAYDELFQYAIRNDYQINSPIFHILRGDDEGEWVELKVRVYKEIT